MDKIKLFIWGSELELEVIFDCFEGEEVLLSQKETVQELIANVKVFEKAKILLVEYCLKKQIDQTEEDITNNIFKYVLPRSIYIKRTKDNSKVAFLLCDYKLDTENGVAIVFRDGEITEVTDQSSVL